MNRGQRENLRRETRAAEALSPYLIDQEDIEAVTDLVADLFHWCAANDVDIIIALDAAREHYLAERKPKAKKQK